MYRYEYENNYSMVTFNLLYRRRNGDKNTLLYRALTTHLETTYYVSGWSTQLIRDAQSRLDTGTRSFEYDFLRTASYCTIYQCNLPAETVPGKLKNFHGQFTAAFNNANQFNAGR